MRNSLAAFVATLAVFATLPPAQAKVSAQEAAKLGNELTPVGAIMAGNEAGTIPAWDPWPTDGNLGPEPKSVTPENYPKTIAPLLQEKPLFVITADNYKQYADQLAKGYQALFELYPDYKMKVYPTHRNVGYPKIVNKFTKQNATTAYLDGCNDCLRGAELGFPFPIPKSGAEAIWNHRVRWRGEAVKRSNDQAIVQPDGSIQITQLIEDVKFPYTNLDPKERVIVNDKDDIMIYYLSETVAPPRNAGKFLLAWEHVGYRSAWLYVPALRRVRRAPNVAYDNPYEGTDGQQFYDQVDMYNGALDRYNYKLVGKKEMIIPYNNYKIAQPDIDYEDDIIGQHHINQDLMRYELHRVWVVDSTLREGTSHQFWRRTFYIDEDGWNIIAVDCYDNRKELWKFQEAANIMDPAAHVTAGTPEVIYDLQSGVFFVTAMFTQGKQNDFSVGYKDQYFSPRALRRRTVR
ncbi:MAG: DUF1329 domain-containing protein [Salinisphaera sp.]|nr:DUF1329 domain-containing protein [Salinisphaera sp.]